MHITNSGRGIHQREVKGIDRLKAAMPRDWYAFTNLDLALGAGKAREIDVILVTNRRIFAIDLKDWYGNIESVDGRWLLDGHDKDASPVGKINDIARQLGILLTKEFAKRPETKHVPVPRVEGLVVLIGKADRSGITEAERAKVLTLGEFKAAVFPDQSDRATFGNIAEYIVHHPLTESTWKERLSRFFNAGPTTLFKPGRRSFQRYVADDSSTFEHPDGIYREYDAREEGTPPSFGTLRLWDFTKVKDARFQTEEGRLEIAGRERQVYHWLRDRSDSIDRNLLTPRLEDPDRSVHYWEIYDRRPRLKRLSDFAKTEVKSLSPVERIELARQLLSVQAELHRNSAAHLDLGGHSIWLEAPTTVQISHLFAARFPEVRSLGDSRYHFLASVTVPEDVLGENAGPMRRDVFLGAVAVHQIIYGCLPGGNPPEWSAAVDAGAEFEVLHHWFAEGLELDAKKRFPDARAALEAFNKATVQHPTPEEVQIGLARYREVIRSQLALASAYPVVGEPIRESDRLDAWRTAADDKQLVVKLWKQSAWGDLRKEGARILAFLDRAAEIKADEPEGIPAIHTIAWLGDAFAVVQEWIEGSSLLSIIEEHPQRWQMAIEALAAVRRLIKIVENLHATGVGHGDLKPENIVIREDGKTFLIDILDFSSLSEGEIQNSAYAIAGGDRFERDRYGLTCLAEEIFGAARFKPEHASRLSKAIATCREMEPRLATILPLVEAIDKTLGELEEADSDLATAAATVLTLAIRGSEIGALEPDEGRFFLRSYRNPVRGPATVHLRGAFEEIEFRLDDAGKLKSATRRRLSQTRIGIVARHEVFNFEGEVLVERSDHNDFSSMEQFLEGDAIAASLAGNGRDLDPSSLEVGDLGASDEDDEERLIEEIAATPVAGPDSVDVPLLWRNLIDSEKELTTEGVAQTDSIFDGAAGRHRLSFELESGTFDFDRNDTVAVERLGNKGIWRRIGELDVQNSRASLVVIETTQYGSAGRRLVEDGQRLRFVSHFETESLRRRGEAVDRILAGNGRAGSLVSVFDPRTRAVPKVVPHSLKRLELAKYDLNADQVAAFERIISARPLGLLQGPPGTGKTRFIAALAHYAITEGLARNVLLSSQSHEAVNTAAEALLKLFRASKEEPSMLRVAMNDDQVSDPIRGYHTRKVEQAFKDRFHASFSERMHIVGTALGMPPEIVNEAILIETAIRPIGRRLAEFQTASEPPQERINGLKETLGAMLVQLGLDPSLVDDIDGSADDFNHTLVECLMTRHGRSGAASADKLNRLLSAARLGRDFVGSASRSQRSFETFLAGTRQVVIGTCVGLGRASLGLTSTAFDLVIVDEAARCTASELLVPLQVARWAVLVGDQAQLQPQHKAEVIEQVAERTKIAKNEIQRSDFERVFETKYGLAAGARLRTQYRMLPPIGKLVSEAFYPKLDLEAGREKPAIDLNLLPGELSHPLTWIETDDLGEAAYDAKMKEGGSRQNRVEADAIVATLETWCAHSPFRQWLEAQTEFPIAVGIICMYAAQRDLIHRKLLRSSVSELLTKHIKVGTVDSYQGKENPIVVLSLVRNNIDGAQEGPVRTIREGFLVAPNRINVAASRAMDRLVIVGARHRWRTAGPMGQLVAGFAKRVVEGSARTVTAREILEPRFNENASPKESRGEGPTGGRRRK
ncbi:AAA domain-containing protein [Mesorhizobium sp. RIZ17]|uniref:AAA domain-containing protein n=1 Tax=Mesorhizobium sp. RIZ17 TaxID=3132743 RepID=UPI003DA7B787